MIKKKVLIFTSAYLPGYKAGGPIRSISNIVDALSDTFDFYIITRDRDSHENAPYSNVKINEWNKVGLAHVFYSSGLTYPMLSFLLKERQYHLLYLNSFFSFKFSFLPILINKIAKSSNKLNVCLAPRGEFSPGALKLKYFKKKLFILLSNFLSIHKGILWQASTEFEKEDIINALKISENEIKIAPNIPSINKNMNSSLIFNGVLKIVFISRISSKKNLDYALEVLSKVKVNVEFNIYGVIDDVRFWDKCQKLINTMPSNINVIYKGAISNEQVPGILSSHDVFFMPTKGENYGHAIVEAFMADIPVLISDTTPWQNLKENNVGWDIPLAEKQLYIDTIEDWYKKVESGHAFQKGSIQKWIFNELNLIEIKRLNQELFL